MASEPAWLDRLRRAADAGPARAGLDARVALALDGADRAVLDIRDGRVAGVAEPGGEPEVELPLTAEQVDALAAGQVSLAVAYMRGDIKPVGSSGALAVLIEVLDEPDTWAALRG
jgi:alkyl sulfatase BDS1-like metallo-beta-lactamase superfamily hydrolase